MPPGRAFSGGQRLSAGCSSFMEHVSLFLDGLCAFCCARGVSFHGSQAPGVWHLVEHPVSTTARTLPDAVFDQRSCLFSEFMFQHTICHAAFWAVESGPGLCFEMCAGADFRAASCALRAFHHSKTRCAGTCLHPFITVQVFWCHCCVFPSWGASALWTPRRCLSSVSRAPPSSGG